MHWQPYKRNTPMHLVKSLVTVQSCPTKPKFLHWVSPSLCLCFSKPSSNFTHSKLENGKYPSSDCSRIRKEGNITCQLHPKTRANLSSNTNECLLTGVIIVQSPVKMKSPEAAKFEAAGAFKTTFMPAVPHIYRRPTGNKILSMPHPHHNTVEATRRWSGREDLNESICAYVLNGRSAHRLDENDLVTTRNAVDQDRMLRFV
jgi:hypothetical protein